MLMFYAAFLYTVVYTLLQVFLIHKYYLITATLGTITFTILTSTVFLNFDFIVYLILANLMFYLMLIAAFFTRPRFVLIKEEKE